jgi:2-keto-4-pentenoate hydratase/2-oxohepta-3-ene-1,7-dioic acid hydratase in catechol pathway
MMRILYFNDFRLGVLKGDQVVDIMSVVQNIPHTGPGNLINGLIANFGDFRARIDKAVAEGSGIPLMQVKIRPPLPKPVNVECMAVNYMEDGTLKETPPINAFHKSPGSIIGHGDTMILPDMAASNFEGEAELAAVIGKRTSFVSAANAMDHIFGYTNFIDGSARGVIPANNSFYQMKSRATFVPIGPFLAAADEVKDPQKLQAKLWVNGALKQNFNTDDMAHNIKRSIEWISSVHDLEPGDIVATGTNHRGLSSLQDGDKVELECEGLGKLVVGIRDDLKRTWSRETRLERAQKGLTGLTPQLTGKYSKG